MEMEKELTVCNAARPAHALPASLIEAPDDKSTGKIMGVLTRGG